MTLSKAKSILILLLAALTIYQTGVLWFVNITNRNFLLNAFPILHQAAIPDGMDRLVVPWRIITIHGDGRFSAQYNGLTAVNFTDVADSRRYGDMVLSRMLQSGSFVSVQPVDYAVLLAVSGYIYEYAFPMEAEWFTQGFGQRSTLLTARGMAPFRQIIIRPPGYDDKHVRVFFLCEDGYAYEFTVALSGSDGPDTFDHDIPTEATHVYYVFMALPGGGQFLRHVEAAFPDVQTTNPYADAHGGFSIDFIQEQVAGFFNNHAVIRPIVGSDVWVYRDVNTVVRYYATNILEYISYRAVDRSVPSTFENDYSAAIQFLERDHLVVNETYLAAFREEYEQRIFYFNYVVGDMSLNMPRSQLSYPIVITVNRGTVVRYQKLAYNFRLYSD